MEIYNHASNTRYYAMVINDDVYCYSNIVTALTAPITRTVSVRY